MLKLNKIYQGDCLEIIKIIDDKSVDLILQDPPYNITACNWEWDIMNEINELWAEWKRIIKDNGTIILTATEPFASKLRLSNLDWYKYDWVWIKDKPSNFLMGKKQPLRYTENILIFYKGIKTYNPQMEKREIKNKRKNKLTSSLLKNENMGINEKTDKYQDRLKSGMNDFIYPRNYQKFNNRTDGLHPTQKPVSLFEYLIKTYTNEGDIVYDGFIGSGTTVVACKNLKRNWIGIDKEEKYVNIANERIKNLPRKLL